ncbi:MAG: hypothetical protein NZ840_12765 [Anaerolineales bacterium]|nr:hypothetical protein [Anaerolineales bacterium]MDW8162908.1 hypothetical protein [Anaerolineales bacterium]
MPILLFVGCDVLRKNPQFCGNKTGADRSSHLSCPLLGKQGFVGAIPPHPLDCAAYLPDRDGAVYLSERPLSTVAKDAAKPERVSKTSLILEISPAIDRSINARPIAADSSPTASRV